MARPRPDRRDDDAFGRRDYDGVTSELLTASIAAAVDPVKSELAWHKWLLFALVGAVLMPKVGGPMPTDAIGALTQPEYVVRVVNSVFS